MKEKQVAALIADHYAPSVWGAVRRVEFPPHPDDPTLKSKRVADVVMVRHNDDPPLYLGFEIKMSRGDLMEELRDPFKVLAVKRFCHQFWLVISEPTMAQGLDIPEGWGVMYPSPDGDRLHVAETPHILNPEAMPVEIERELLRKVIRQATPSPDDLREAAARRLGQKSPSISNYFNKTYGERSAKRGPLTSKIPPVRVTATQAHNIAAFGNANSMTPSESVRTLLERGLDHWESEQGETNVQEDE